MKWAADTREKTALDHETMLTLDIDTIPDGKPLEVDLDATPGEYAELFADVPEFALARPEAFEVKLNAQRMSDGTIRLWGYVLAPLAFCCGRCLEDRELEVDAEVEYLLIPREQWRARYEFDGDEEVDIELGEEELDMDTYEGDELELGRYIRESVLLELPTFAVCGPELEDECDAAYAANVGKETMEKNEEAGIDLRWSKLLEIKKDMKAPD